MNEAELRKKLVSMEFHDAREYTQTKSPHNYVMLGEKDINSLLDLFRENTEAVEDESFSKGMRVALSMVTPYMRPVDLEDITKKFNKKIDVALKKDSELSNTQNKEKE